MKWLELQKDIEDLLDGDESSSLDLSINVGLSADNVSLITDYTSGTMTVRGWIKHKHEQLADE